MPLLWMQSANSEFVRDEEAQSMFESVSICASACVRARVCVHIQRVRVRVKLQ